MVFTLRSLFNNYVNDNDNVTKIIMLMIMKM